jgi:hypothetical protein
VREFIYLSKRKLSQFADDKPRWGFFRRIRNFGVTAPLSLGGVNISLSEPGKADFQLFERVRARIQVDAEWYENTSKVSPGSWVQFEARMNYAATSMHRNQLLPGSDGPLIFWTPSPTINQSTVQICLHATADGLLGEYPEIFVENRIDSNGRPDRNDNFQLRGPFTSSPAFFQIIQRLQKGAEGIDSPGRSKSLDRSAGEVLGEALTWLGYCVPPYAASWMTGLARVTAIINDRRHDRATQWLVASPLHVERVQEPE